MRYFSRNGKRAGWLGKCLVNRTTNGLFDLGAQQCNQSVPVQSNWLLAGLAQACLEGNTDTLHDLVHDLFLQALWQGKA